MDHLHQLNCKQRAHWINIPKMGPGWRIRRRIQHPSDCHTGDTPAPSNWNWMDDWMEGLPSVKLIHAYHFNLLASHPDSSNVRMSPSQTGPFALHMWSSYCQPIIQCGPMYPTPSTRYSSPVGHLTSGVALSSITPVRRVKIKIK